MSKKARPPRVKSSSSANEKVQNNRNSNTDNVIILPRDLNRNRLQKASIGIVLIVLGFLAVFSPGNRDDSCIFFLLSLSIGLSLILQSVPKKRLSVAAIISYTILSFFFIIFGFFFLLFG